MSKSTASATHRFSDPANLWVKLIAELRGRESLSATYGRPCTQVFCELLQPWDESDNSRNNYHGSYRWL